MKGNLMRNYLLKRWISTSTKKSSPKFMAQYKELFDRSHAIEMVLPRNISSLKELADWGFNNTKTNDFLNLSDQGLASVDLQFFKRCISDPTFDLIERGGKGWRPVLGLLLANDFGMNISKIDDNKLLYYLLGAWEVIHNSTLIMDDMEDGSLKRRGEDCTYIKYGLGVAINTGSLLNFLCLYKLKHYVNQSDEKYSQIVRHFTDELINLHLGQSWDIDWHNWSFIPSEENYFQMTSCKTGGIFRLVTKLVWAINNIDNSRMSKLWEMTSKTSIAFQLTDDIISLENNEYAVQRGIFGEDIHEGKRSLIVIHSYNNLDEKNKKRLVDILNMKTDDSKLINE